MYLHHKVYYYATRCSHLSLQYTVNEYTLAEYMYYNYLLHFIKYRVMYAITIYSAKRILL